MRVKSDATMEGDSADIDVDEACALQCLLVSHHTNTLSALLTVHYTIIIVYLGYCWYAS